MPAHRYVAENGLAAMLVAKRSAGVAPEMNLRECVTHMSNVSFKPRGDITRSLKQRVLF